MTDERGAGAERPGPFSLLEPLGLLWGRDAAAAQAAGTGLPLAGGPGVFTLVHYQGRLLPAPEAARVWPGAVAGLIAPAADWAGLGRGPVIFGILNVTPDSFSDGGSHPAADSAIAAGLQMLADGADVLDIGGESTRPGADLVPPALEQARILPVIRALARAGAVISADTRNAETMARALEAGARIINDVSALRHDEGAMAVVAGAGCPVLLMHMRGTPASMKSLAVYDDVAAEVVAELAERMAAAEAAGIQRHRIAVDPGFGFAKTAAQNLELLQRLPGLLTLGRPVLAGISRKATIGMLTGEAEAGRRDPGSNAAALFALSRGARLLRVHDVRGTRQAVSVWNGLNRV